MIDDENPTTEPEPRRYRRRSTPLVAPEGMPEPESKVEKPRRPSIADVKGIGGMEATSWAGIPMWRCPKCHGTTFDEAQSLVHQCKAIRYADEADLDG